MNRKINIGVLGCADIAERSVIPAIIELEDQFNLVGVASRSEEKAKIFAQKFNTTPYSTYSEMIENGCLDAVYIPLPNSLHFEWVKTSLNKGLHVLVEKSLASSFEEVSELVEIARSKNLALVENFQFRFHSQLQTIKNLLEEKIIGDLRCVRSSFGFPPFSSPENIRYQRQLKGGALYDAGAYPLKISQIFLGNNISVLASTLNYDKAIGVDIWGGAFIKQNDGSLFSEIAFGFDHYYQCNIELWGSKGKLVANRIFTAPMNYHPELIIENENGKQILQLPCDHHFKNMLVHFFRLINEGDGLEAEYDQNCLQAKLLNEVISQSQINI